MTGLRPVEPIVGPTEHRETTPSVDSEARARRQKSDDIRSSASYTTRNSRTEVSQLPDTSRRPSELKHTDFTPPTPP